jgi:integrase
VRDGLIQRNPAAVIKRPAIERKDAGYLSAHQAEALLEAIRGDRLDRAVLRVRWTLSRTSAGLELGEPKTEKSRRTVPLPAPAVETLRAHRKRQAVEQLAVGSLGQSSGLVFTSEIGTPLEPRNVLRRFEALAERAGMRGVHLHTLRHSAASFLPRQGRTRRSFRNTSATRPTRSPRTSTATLPRCSSARRPTAWARRSTGDVAVQKPPLRFRLRF